MTTPLIRTLSALAVLTLCGCSSSNSAVMPVAPTPTLTNITVSWCCFLNDANTRFQLYAIGRYSDATTQNLTKVVEWQVSNLTVVTIEPLIFTTVLDGRTTTGIVGTIVGDGRTVVTATYQGKVGSVDLIFPEPI